MPKLAWQTNGEIVDTLRKDSSALELAEYCWEDISDQAPDLKLKDLAKEAFLEGVAACLTDADIFAVPSPPRLRFLAQMDNVFADVDADEVFTEISDNFADDELEHMIEWRDLLAVHVTKLTTAIEAAEAETKGEAA